MSSFFSFFYDIIRSISMFFSRLLSPLQSAIFNLRSLRTNNPIAQAGRLAADQRRRMQYYTSSARGFRLPGISFPKPVRDFFKRLRGGKDEEETDSGVEVLEETRWANAGRKLQPVGLRSAEYSQIHLIDQVSNQRLVVHIGTTIGRSEAEIHLKEKKHLPVNLRFTQVNPEEYGAHIMITYLGGDLAVEVDGEPLIQNAPLYENTVINIEGHRYKCELFAWQGFKYPPVTRVDAGWLTRVGPNREHNEDAIGIFQHPDAYLFAIADGVGGAEAGEVVSKFAIEYLLAVFRENVAYQLRWYDVLEKAVDRINREVRHFIERSALDERGAGTTLTAVIIEGWEAYVLHIGDSRLYHWRKGRLRKVTTDHVQEIMAQPQHRQLSDHKVTGKPTNGRETANSSNGNGANGQSNEQNGNEPVEEPRFMEVLTRAIGKEKVVQPELFKIPLQPNDKLLLCTDGLTRVIPDHELATMIAERAAPQQITKGLVYTAIDRDTQDNVSAILLDVMPVAYERDVWNARDDYRVYTGFRSLRPLRYRQNRTDSEKDIFITDYDAIVDTPRTNTAFLSVLLVAAMLLGALWLFSLRSSGGVAAGTDAGTPTFTPTAAISATPTLTPSETPLRSPTPTPTITLTPSLTITPSRTPTPTRIPPTSTLRPSGGAARPISPYTNTGLWAHSLFAFSTWGDSAESHLANRLRSY